MDVLTGIFSGENRRQGTGKVRDLEFGLPAAPVILGVITAIGGGLTRDVLAGRTTLLMRPEFSRQFRPPFGGTVGSPTVEPISHNSNTDLVIPLAGFAENPEHQSSTPPE